VASSIRIRAIARDGRTEVQTLIQHPMDSGFIKNDKGEFIPAHYIRELTFEHNGRLVFLADWGTAVSKDPYVKFAFQGGNKGDELKVGWIDNKGETDTTTVKIQ